MAERVGNAARRSDRLSPAEPRTARLSAHPGQEGVSRRGVVKTFAAGALAGSLGVLGRGTVAEATQDATAAAGTPVATGQEDLTTPWWKASSPFLNGVMTSPNLEPAILHPDWDDEAKAKLSAL